MQPDNQVVRCPFCFLYFQSSCNKLCASDAYSSGYHITPWHCLSIVASIPLLQQTIKELTGGAVDSFSCTMIKLLCFVDIFFFFQGLWERKWWGGKKLLRSGHKGWYVQIYSIYTSPGQRPVSLVICHPTPISSPIPWGLSKHGTCWTFHLRGPIVTASVWGSERKLGPGRSQTQPDILL